MNIDVRPDIGFDFQDYQVISPFENLALVIGEEGEYKTTADLNRIVNDLFKLGYAWSDNEHTRSQLFYGVVPHRIYACFDACIYFVQPLSTSFKVVDGRYVKRKVLEKRK